jgi:DNA polymerase alpha subunit A
LFQASFPALPNDLKGQTFSHVFGTKSSFLELLLLERGLKGPSWIDIVNPEPSNSTISWCKIEVIMLNYIHIKTTFLATKKKVYIAKPPSRRTL